MIQLLVVVQFGPVFESSGPSEDAGNRISGGFPSFLVFPVMSGDCAVGSLSFDAAVRGVQHGGHQSE